MKIHHVATYCFFAAFCTYPSVDGLCQGSETGVQAARQIIGELDSVHGVPQSSIDSLCEGIAKIESSPSVRVSFVQMSPWRKEMLYHFQQERLQNWQGESDNAIAAL